MLIPFIDEAQLVSAMEPCSARLDQEVASFLTTLCLLVFSLLQSSPLPPSWILPSLPPSSLTPYLPLPLAPPHSLFSPLFSFSTSPSSLLSSLLVIPLPPPLSQEIERNTRGVCLVCTHDPGGQSSVYPSPWPQVFPDVNKCRVRSVTQLGQAPFLCHPIGCESAEVTLHTKG